MSNTLQHRIRKSQTRLKEGAQSGKTFGQIFQGGGECLFVLCRAIDQLFDKGALIREQVPGWNEQNEIDLQRQRRNYRIYRMGLDNVPPLEIAESVGVDKTVVFGVLRTLKRHGLFNASIEELGEEEGEDEDDGGLGLFPNPPGWWREMPCHPILYHVYGSLR